MLQSLEILEPLEPPDNIEPFVSLSQRPSLSQSHLSHLILLSHLSHLRYLSHLSHLAHWNNLIPIELIEALSHWAIWCYREAATEKHLQRSIWALTQKASTEKHLVLQRSPFSEAFEPLEQFELPDCELYRHLIIPSMWPCAPAIKYQFAKKPIQR